MAINLSEEMLSTEYQNFKRAKTLTDRFNSGAYDWLPTKDKEQIALIAAQYGTDFKTRDSKPLRKALFDFADMAAFGILPDKWRPETMGEKYGFGESPEDRMAGGVGSLLGFGLGGPGKLLKGAYKGIKGAKAWWKGGTGGAGGISTEGAATNKMAQLNPSRDIPLQLGQGTRQLGQGAPRLGGRPNLLGMGSRVPDDQIINV